MDDAEKLRLQQMREETDNKLRTYLPRLEQLRQGYSELIETMRTMPERPGTRRLKDDSISKAIADERRVYQAKLDIERALATKDTAEAKTILDEVQRVLSHQTSALDLLSKSVLEDAPISTGRAMLSAVETTAFAAASLSVESPIVAHGTPEDRRNFGRDTANVLNGVFGPIAGQRRGVGTLSADKVTIDRRGKWFDDAIESVRTSQEGKVSCPLLKGDIVLMWKVAWGKDADSAIDNWTSQSIQESRGVIHRYDYLRRRFEKAIDVALLRAEGLRGAKGKHDDGEMTPAQLETNKRVGLIITCTELNMELTALAMAEMVLHRGKPANSHQTAEDLFYGFGPTSLVTNAMVDQQRFLDFQMGDINGVAQFVYELWRTALEHAAFPNVSDTLIIDMQEASKAAMKQMIAPPDGSASNAEVKLMQVAYWAAMVCAAADAGSKKAVDNGWLLNAYTWLARLGEVPSPKIVFDAVLRVRDPEPHSSFYGSKEWEIRRAEGRGFLRQWACMWRESGYARVDVSHKLAAALMLTDVKEDLDVRGPWPAFSVHIPPGITRVSRVLVWSGQRSDEDKQTIRLAHVIFEDGTFGECSENHLTQVEIDLLTNFVRGVCLAAEQGHAQHAGKHGTQGAKAKGGAKRWHKGAPIAGERYQLAAPVKIDLRDVVREHLDGKRRGGSPKVQFIVRGHWRNQVHGPGRQHRKRIWIEPFWKGEEGAVAVLRSAVIDGDKVNPG